MPIYSIRGINVDFPYDAYDSQITYMDRVIQALQGKSNALLESPTGTGKTLCLLCATLAYRASLGPFTTGQLVRSDDSESSSSQAGTSKPKIVYTSRTHSQLRQVIKELKKTSYRPKMMILGSREQLCIHDKVKLLRGKAQNTACQYVRKRRTKHFCQHYKMTTDFIKGNPQIGDEPVDIEDLVNIGRSCGPCPYYVSRELIKSVDILFAPYNYLIDRSYKDKLGIEWRSSILIFDEAHNLEGICADAASFDLPSALLSACISEAKNCIDISLKRRNRDKSDDKSSNPDNFAILRALLLKLEKRIADVPIESKELGFTKPGPYIFELFADLNITKDTASKLTEIIEEAVLLLEEDANAIDSKESHGTSCRLETIGDILNIVFKDGGISHAKYYRVHVQERLTRDSDVFKGHVSKDRTLSWWCFNPGISMEDFLRRGVGSVILTSGTLSPMDSFAYELKLDFPIRLENPHVISSNQIWAGVLPTGPSSYSFNSSFRNRDVLEYKQELGNAIVNFARIVPDGLLVFFPSYYIMDQCISCWKDNSQGSMASHCTIWGRICKFKQPVVEPRQSSLFSDAIEDFKSKLNDPSTSGAVFFAVCRGKVSEGLDFADQCGRAVVITGLPFVTRTDPKVRLKREFLDENARNTTVGPKPLTGEQWYDQQASRAVNQAVGRVIRHRHDYGAILFCDERFATSYRQSQVSRWIQPHIKCYSKFGDVVYSLTRFFRTEVPRPVKAESVESVSNGLHIDASRPAKAEPLGSVSNGFFRVEAAHTVKTEPLETASNGSACGERIKILPDECCSEKKLRTSAMDEDCYVVSSSAGINVGKIGKFSLCNGIVPANRSSLSQKQMQAVSVKQERSTHGLESWGIVDLTGSASPDRKADVELLARCSSKRKKNLEIGRDFIEYKKVFCEMTSRTIEAPSKCSHLTSDSTGNEKCRSSLTAKKNSTLEVCCNETLQRKASSSKNTGTNSVSFRDEEAKGQSFLNQARQILEESEYKEFIGYMNALKSRAMKINSVLQSVVKLFSNKEKHPLLRRFKDFIPEKFHSLYEEYCTSMVGSAEM